MTLLRKEVKREMRIEIRDDGIVIDGYVNAVERDSKVIHDRNGTFVERIRAGAFRRALERAERTGYKVKVLLNHRYDRLLASAGDGRTDIKEDTIGLRCRCEIRDEEVIRKAKEKKLTGWSFGFIAVKDRWEDGEVRHREVRDMELKEVSILDDTKRPAYAGTSIEVRGEDDLIELRCFEDDVEICGESGDGTSGKSNEENGGESGEEPGENPADNHEWENRYLATMIGI